LCDYRLMPERVGGMDRFFWLFDAECKELGYEIIWFFPNVATYEGYVNLSIIAAEGKSIEQTFLAYDHSFDLIFTHFLELCTPFYKAVKKLKLATKIIAIDHNPRPFNGYPLKKRFQKKIKGFLYASFIDLFVGVSQYTVNEILKDFGFHLKNRTKVVYNGIAYKKIKKRASRSFKNPTFVVACHLRYSKGIQDLIEAVALLPKEIVSNIYIDVYGEGEYQSTLISLASKYHLQDHFIFKGSVSNLYEIFYLYDYMLQPTHMECFSLAILESLSANVPVITTPVGGNEEVIKNGVNGYILPVQNPKEWSDMIKKIYMLEEKINNNTFDLIENEFSIEKMVNKYLELILIY
jgi:glycosyltransferase involved in cell wall biosynthesis